MTNKPQREQLGFGKAGYIMICKGDTYAYKDWLKEQGACYRKWWGWAFASSIPLPELPAGITAVRLDWDKVGSADGMTLLPEEQIVMEKMKSVIAHTYELFGFAPLDTPILELAEVLLSK